jgi:Flp pilus assembly protein TadG
MKRLISMVGPRLPGARALLNDRRGVAAIEFALIAPILLSLYLMTMEFSQGIEADKKVGRISSMVADLVTQQDETSKSQLEAIMKIGEAILQPYNRSQPTITVTAIQVSNDTVPTVKVAWSRKLVKGAGLGGLTKGSTTTVPDKLKIKGSFLIRVTADLGYKPMIVWSVDQQKVLGLAAAFDGIAMSETYYLRPRMTAEIACTDC